MSYDLKVLEQGCEELGIALNDTQKQQFIAFYDGVNWHSLKNF